jgi:hypothetical protein
MLEDLNARYRTILAKQLALNEVAWRTLQSHGVTEETQLRLDFLYVAPDRRSAQSLQAVLTDQTDYDVQVESSGSLLTKRWSVVGTTRPTTVSAAILDQWVDWMVTAGLHQNCEFDGWGTQM